MRSDTNVGQGGLALSLHSNSSQGCSIGLRSGLFVGQSSSSKSVAIDSEVGDLCALCASASADPAPSFYVAELLLFPIASTLL